MNTIKKFLLVGLGNPEDKYTETLHNIGFKIIDKIILTYSNSTIWKKKNNALYLKFNLQDYSIITVKPNTYMNKSGEALLQFLSYYKIPLKNLIVFHDDIDLETGRVRIKINGGHGGHNGIRSINNKLNSLYTRVKIGVDRPTYNIAVSDYVLSKANHEKQKLLSSTLTCIAENLQYILQNKYDLFMSYVSKNKNTFLKNNKQNK